MDTIREMLNVDDDWKVLLSFLPESWQLLAKETGALLRNKKFTPESLLRSLLIHLADGCSLRETSTRTTQGDIAKVSDVALLKRLNASGEWFRQMSLRIRRKWVTQPEKTLLCSEYRIRLIDGSTGSEPGATGSTWRIHYSVQLSNLQCDEVHVTGTSVGYYVGLPEQLFITIRHLVPGVMSEIRLKVALKVEQIKMRIR